MLEVERTRCGDDKDIIGAALSLRDQRLKDCLRILPEGIRYGECVDAGIRRLGVNLIRNAFFVKNAHYIGLFVLIFICHEGSSFSAAATHLPAV